MEKKSSVSNGEKKKPVSSKTQEDRAASAETLIGPSKVSRVESLIKRQKSDIARWSRMDSVNRNWDRRLKVAADMLEPSMSVLDLGCGKMALRDYLPPGCVYFPADIVKRTEDTHLIELNQGIWPDVRAESAVALGLLEYLYDIDAFFRGVRACAPLLVFTYHVRADGLAESRNARLQSGWLSDFSLPDLVTALYGAGWYILRLHAGERKRHFTQYFFKIALN